MSQQDFERTDQEVMNLVNSAASTQAKQTADAIEKELNKPKGTLPCDDYDNVAKEVVSRVVVEELHQKRRRGAIITHSLAALAGIVAAGAMVIALKKPECMVYIANVFCLIGGVVAVSRVEKIVKLFKE